MSSTATFDSNPFARLIRTLETNSLLVPLTLLPFNEPTSFLAGLANHCTSPSQSSNTSHETHCPSHPRYSTASCHRTSQKTDSLHH